ncbi:hypothetical protein DUI87_09799 [Hirundo rustica rustica]|uniref:Uncharacterized protein n=1 Tax=Hirundo rustica rustica TaxID=333673 RepID=A0A3M0KYT0_HIRRU|nr:hypothetical protein DUI87_09799 [Hirundo rustica rustica]
MEPQLFAWVPEQDNISFCSHFAGSLPVSSGTRSGLVLSCGSNSFGQLELPQISGPCLISQKIESLKEKVMNVTAGLRHALAATDSGLVLQWRNGMASWAKHASQGKALLLFLTAKESCEVAGLEDIKVKTVAAGSYHSVSLTDEGHLYVWGSNKHGQLVSRDIFLAEPKKIDTQCFSHEKIRAVWSGWTHLVARTGRIFKKRAAESLKLKPYMR